MNDSLYTKYLTDTEIRYNTNYVLSPTVSSKTDLVTVDVFSVTGFVPCPDEDSRRLVPICQKVPSS